MKVAPEFTLPDQNGATHKLSDYKGRWVVLYFYPKDDTPGCTTEACAFRDGRDELVGAGAVVIGVSKDSVESHAKFAGKYGINFTILSDESGETIKAYDAWGLTGTKRRTVLIDPTGNIAKEYPSVSPESHAGEVLKDLQALQAA